MGFNSLIFTFNSVNNGLCWWILKEDIPILTLTSYVGHSEALCLTRAVGVRVEVNPDSSSGGDEGRRKNRSTEAILSFPCGAEQQPVPPAVPGVLQVKTVKTGHSKHLLINAQDGAYTCRIASSNEDRHIKFVGEKNIKGKCQIKGIVHH